MDRFNKRLRASMLAAGQETPTHLAKVAGLPLERAREILRMRRARLSGEELYRIALALKVRMRWLVDGKGPPDDTVMADDNVAAALIVLSRLDETRIRRWLEEGLGMTEEGA